MSLEITSTVPLRMILPPGETDKHMFDLEAACLKLEKLSKAADSVKDSAVVLGRFSIYLNTNFL